MSSQAVEKFGNKVRVRVCGLCYRGNDLLLINHKGLYNHDFWAPPGGGLEFGERAQNGLKREFLEECGLTVVRTRFQFTCEVINPPFHAIELFFEVFATGEPLLGNDPEMGENQLLHQIKFWSPEALNSLPSTHRHGIFNITTDPKKLRNLSGIYPLPNM